MSPPRAVLPRPILLPGLPRIWRGPHTLQLGLHPTRSILLDLPDPRVAGVLDLLDGTRTERSILSRAATLAMTADEARHLLDRLRETGLLLPAQQFLPPSVTGATRRRLTPEATALALAPEFTPTRPLPPSGSPSAPPHSAPPFAPAAASSSAVSRGGADRAATADLVFGAVGASSRPRIVKPALALKRRIAARVVVAGRGRLAGSIAVALAEAGVGHVDPDVSGPVTEADLPGGPLHAADIGLSQRIAICAAVERAAPGTVTHRIRRGLASVTVQLGHDEPVTVVAAAHASRRQPHLSAAIRDGAAVVGPFVPSSGGPCLQCLDLHRGDLDHGWPDLTAQLQPGATEPCTVATLLAATAFATAEVLTFLDGGTPETVGAAIEITAPSRTRWRRWPPHPDCGCVPRRRGQAGLTQDLHT